MSSTDIATATHEITLAEEGGKTRLTLQARLTPVTLAPAGAAGTEMG